MVVDKKKYPHLKDEEYMNFCKAFIENKYKESERLASNNISYDLNGEVPKLYIKGQEVGVVSMTQHYVTSSDGQPGQHVVTVVYMCDGDPEQHIISVDKNTGKIFKQ